MPPLPQRRTPDRRRLLRASVLRAERTSTHFVTLTVGGEDLADFAPLGFDQWCRLFFPREGQRGLRLPTASSTRWLAQHMLMSTASRPWVRNYTIRAARPGEVDIEFAVHGDGGPASKFAENARPGDEVGILDEGVTYLPPEGVTQLLLADESAIPAALAILESSPGLRATVLLEVGARDDVQAVDVPLGAEVQWLVREDGRIAGAARARRPRPARSFRSAGIHVGRRGKRARHRCTAVPHAGARGAEADDRVPGVLEARSRRAGVNTLRTGVRRRPRAVLPAAAGTVSGRRRPRIR